ncbi:hypothetical protein K435DRAFT_769945 [Dendrothele bispora CBS 962.96]|uniref:Uncharacterized protein n=1 Tax=Dendrothele bispora (strain CBS 962.96) TaxID=1314807 RepID=A0A4S8KR33_DENBC|nr:hypothetical protein K435DRAFT_769945 [Dendrothele bispora CBS 962.96]
MAAPPPVLEVHTPFSSFAVVHSITQDSLQSLCDKLTRKVHTSYQGERVGPGWLKYEFNSTIWNLDDDSDYTIFAWRQQQQQQQQQNHSENDPVTIETQSSGRSSNGVTRPPIIHLHNPSHPLPAPPDYQNPSYYIFNQSRARSSRSPSTAGSPSLRPSRKSKKSRRSKLASDDDKNSVPKHKKEFDKFHGENGVRTVMGSIGPVQNVRMLLKSSYSHVYISRKFALEHGFIPADAAPGHYGYSGLVNIGTWPITLTPSASSAPAPSETPLTNGSTKKTKRSKADAKGPKPTMMTVYLSEEPHFDVVLGRSFFEKRLIRTSVADLTDVICLDTGEKIECELVILKDGRGEIVTVT